MLIVRSDLGYGVVEGCSGTLLADGVSVLTSAHCLADSGGVNRALSATVTFTTTDGSFTTQAVRFDVNPAFDGSATSPNDVAVLRLTATAPDNIERYGLYTGDAADQTMTLAGYGFGGTGDDGYDPIEYPFGTLRTGQNQYLTDSDSGDLMFQFSDPPMVNNEGFIAPGDQGGPSFIAGEIAGVHSYVMDPLDGLLNSSYGEFGADASIAYNLVFLASAMESVPEPTYVAMIGIALVAIGVMGQKRKRQ